jgi:hypothetical protein
MIPKEELAAIKARAELSDRTDVPPTSDILWLVEEVDRLRAEVGRLHGLFRHILDEGNIIEFTVNCAQCEEVDHEFRAEAYFAASKELGE